MKNLCYLFPIKALSLVFTLSFIAFSGYAQVSKYYVDSKSPNGMYEIFLKNNTESYPKRIEVALWKNTSPYYPGTYKYRLCTYEVSEVGFARMNIALSDNKKDLIVEYGNIYYVVIHTFKNAVDEVKLDNNGDLVGVSNSGYTETYTFAKCSPNLSPKPMNIDAMTKKTNATWTRGSMKSGEYFEDGKYQFIVSTAGMGILNTDNYQFVWRQDFREAIKELKVQTDGNVVVYSRDGNILWESYTTGRGGNATFLDLDSDGNLIIYNGTAIGGYGDALWATGTCGGVLNGCGSVGRRN